MGYSLSALRASGSGQWVLRSASWAIGLTPMGRCGVVPRLRCYWTVPWGSLYWLRHWPGRALGRAIQFRVYVSFLREWQPDW